MAKKYTTKDLKKEVDRLNREFKKESAPGKPGVRFGFGKRTREGKKDTYYITVRDKFKEVRKEDYYGYRNWSDYNNLLSEKEDIGKLMKDAKSKDFRERKNDIIFSADDYAWEGRWERKDARKNKRYAKKQKKAFEKYAKDIAENPHKYDIPR